MAQSLSSVYINGVNQHDCGYCKGVNSSKSYGVISDRMTCHDYESLMTTGWRRSGKYFYKPIMWDTCCPQYPIRFGKTNIILYLMY
jgi:arginine-tRNA-protein transferase